MLRQFYESPNKNIIRIGLTGGIAAGKSTVSKLITSKFKIPVIDYDMLTKFAYQDPDIKKQLVSNFGTDSKDEISKTAFNDQTVLKKLGRIIHPKVFALAFDKENQIVSDMLRRVSGDENIIIIHEIPLLVESNVMGLFSKIIAISISKDVAIKRLIEFRGISKHDAEKRVESQAENEDREAFASLVINGNDSLDNIEKQLKLYFQTIP